MSQRSIISYELSCRYMDVFCSMMFSIIFYIFSFNHFCPQSQIGYASLSSGAAGVVSFPLPHSSVFLPFLLSIHSSHSLSFSLFCFSFLIRFRFFYSNSHQLSSSPHLPSCTRSPLSSHFHIFRSLPFPFLIISPSYI